MDEPPPNKSPDASFISSDVYKVYESMKIALLCWNKCYLSIYLPDQFSFPDKTVLSQSSEPAITYFFYATVSFILHLQCIFTINIWYSNYHELFILLFGIGQLLFSKSRYVEGSPNPSPEWYYCRTWFCRKVI